MPNAFVPPPYPYDRLRPIIDLARERHGEVVDLSIGTPCDPPPEIVENLSVDSFDLRRYPPSVGAEVLRSAASGWFTRRLGIDIPAGQIAACIGTKEFVVGVPHWLRLRSPAKDTVLYPAVSYPSYAMGAQLAGCRAVPVGVNDDWSLDLSSIAPSDAERAICLWCNTPANPTGALDDLGVIAAWGRDHGVPVFSDECYLEFTWEGHPALPSRAPGHSILEHGSQGVIAVHSLSKRSNLAGARVGFYSGDEALVEYLSEVRKHAGLMVPGPAQQAAAVALGDNCHVDDQRLRYWQRLNRMAKVLESQSLAAPLPAGGFYLWVPAPSGDAWALAEQLARDLGVVVSPGEFYGDFAAGFVRIAVVQPDDKIEHVARRADML